MNKKELYSAIGFLKISETRQKILDCLEDNYMMPSEIASKTGLGTTQVSNSLADLKSRKLVECVNEEDKKGRLYEVTDIGKEVLEHLKNNKI